MVKRDIYNTKVHEIFFLYKKHLTSPTLIHLTDIFLPNSIDMLHFAYKCTNVLLRHQKLCLYKTWNLMSGMHQTLCVYKTYVHFCSISLLLKSLIISFFLPLICLHGKFGRSLNICIFFLWFDNIAFSFSLPFFNIDTMLHLFHFYLLRAWTFWYKPCIPCQTKALHGKITIWSPLTCALKHWYPILRMSSLNCPPFFPRLNEREVHDMTLNVI